MCIGTAFKYQTHYEDKLPQPQRPLKAWTSKTLPVNAARFRNIIHVTNHIMSHILHFYHLVALDYVKPVVWNFGGSGAFTPLTRPFLAPRYSDSYYINDKRVLMAATLLNTLAGAPPDHPAVATLKTLPGFLVSPGDAVNNYLTGQYLKALNIRRMCHEIQAIFSGRAPHNSGWTPSGETSAVKKADIDKAREILYEGSSGTGTPAPNYPNIGDPGPAPGTVMDFVGDPLDFANGKAFTMMFDVVAAAHLFPEYFWIGNAWGNFMAYGWGEEAGTIQFSDSLYGGILYPGGKTNPDQRASRRGWVKGDALGCRLLFTVNNINIMNFGESVDTGSKYTSYAGFKHPWAGVTNPDPETTDPNKYSWLKAPRYDTVGLGNQADYAVFEVGPLSRMVVNGCYFAGVLHDTNGDGTGTVIYPVAPVAGQVGPDLRRGAALAPNGIYKDGGALERFILDLRAVYDDIDGNSNPADPVGGPYTAGSGAITGGPDLSSVNYNGDSVLDRIATRALETRMQCDELKHFLDQVEGTINPLSTGWSTTGITDDTVPIIKDKVKKGYGMTEASRGALSHWIKYKNGKITRYQSVVPTTWNASPRDPNGNMGPAEKSLTGAWVAEPTQAIELPRITHSYDFCIACAVHVITPEGEVVKIDVPPLPG